MKKSEIKEGSLLMIGAMVLATLELRKTQTRRILTARNSLVDGHPTSEKQWAKLDWSSNKIFVDKGPSPAGNLGPYLHVPARNGDTVHRVYPRLEIGDHIWIKETFFDVRKYRHAPIFAGVTADFIYRAEYEYRNGRVIGCHHWKPSIFMPRIASRLTLELAAIRVERVQDITTKDAEAEGVQYKVIPAENAPGKVIPLLPLTDRWLTPHLPKRGEITHDSMMRSHYAGLWDSINAARGFGWATNPWVWVLEFKKL